MFLLTYDPFWVSDQKEESIPEASLVVDDLASFIQRVHDSYLSALTSTMCNQLASELIDEALNFVIHAANVSIVESPEIMNAVVVDLDIKNAEAEYSFVKVVEETNMFINTKHLLVVEVDSPVRKLADELLDEDCEPQPTKEVCEGQHTVFISTDMDANTCAEHEHTAETNAEFEALWSKRKLDVEKNAETRARVVFRQWQRDRLTLEQAIDSSLKEYGEMYEKAHALRLMFEEEKNQWSKGMVAHHIDDTCADAKRRRGQETLTPYPAWFTPQNTVHSGQYGQYPAMQHQYSLDGEFQYTVDDADDSCGAMGTGPSAAASAAVISPLKKLPKKFTVPLKQAQED